MQEWLPLDSKEPPHAHEAEPVPRHRPRHDTLAARANAATTVDVEKGQGSNVSTQFSGSADYKCPDGSDGNIFAVGFLTGIDTVQKAKGGGPVVNDAVLVDVFEYFDSCSGIFTSGSGQVVNGFHRPNKNLTSARFSGTGAFQSFDIPNTIPISIDLTIRGTGSWMRARRTP